MQRGKFLVRKGLTLEITGFFRISCLIKKSFFSLEI